MVCLHKASRYPSFTKAPYSQLDKGLFQSFKVSNRYSLENIKRWQRIISLIIR
nr:MAG TPA: hypothetical protein [Caudoviricetes sp.]